MLRHSLSGGKPITPENAAKLSEQWGFEVPTTKGLIAPEMINAAYEGQLDVLFSVGGNFLEVLPEPDYVEEALKRVPLRVHMDIICSSQMLVEPADTVVLLPASTRYEVPGGVTETSTERRVIFSPEIPGPRIGEARPEWEVFMELARRVRPEIADKLHFSCEVGVSPALEDGTGKMPIHKRVQLPFAKRLPRLSLNMPESST
jgi:predicted molibdopterin-dependent oxidoreductase YjgC